MKIARVAIGYRQRVAVAPVTGLELSLKIYAPKLIRGCDD